MKSKHKDQVVTPLHQAAAAGDLDEVKKLLAKGAFPDCLNHHNQSPLYSALLLPICHDAELKSRKEAIFKLLYEKKPSMITKQDNSGDTPFHLMAVYGFDDLFSELLTKHQHMAYMPNNHTQYLIHTAILNQRRDIMACLLKLDNVWTQTDSNDEAALHYAARRGTRDMVKLCCEVSKDVNVLNRDNRTPWQLAFEEGNTDAMLELEIHGAEKSELNSMVRSLR